MNKMTWKMRKMIQWNFWNCIYNMC